MRALVTTSAGIELDDVPAPNPPPGGVVVQVLACGICGSDVHLVQDGRAAAGTVLGHEFAGVISAVGKGVTGWHEGRPVAVNPIGSCGTCAACRAELPFRCATVPNLGMSAPGAFAEYVAVPQEQLVGLPAGLDPWVGSRAEPLAVALRAVELGGVREGDAVAVFGVGSIGLNVIIGLRLAGAGRIVAVGRSAGRRAAAATFGADVVLDAGETSLVDYAAREGISFASTYECAGAATALDECTQVLVPGGTCVQVALPSEPVSFNLRGLAGRGQKIVGSCAFVASNYEAAVDHLASGRVAAEPLVSARVPLREGADMFVKLRTPGDLVGVVVEPWR